MQLKLLCKFVFVCGHGRCIVISASIVGMVVKEEYIVMITEETCFISFLSLNSSIEFETHRQSSPLSNVLMSVIIILYHWL